MDNLRGSLLMVLAMAGFALEDAFVKTLARDLHVGHILMLIGAGGTVIFTIAALSQRDRLISRDILNRPLLLRNLGELTAAVCFVTALALADLSLVSAILQATPLAVTFAAALFLGETVGWRRWSAIVVGLIGVLIVLRPGADSFSPLSILAVLGMLGFAGRDLASRAAPASLGTHVLGFYGFLAVVLAGALYALWEQEAFVQPSGTGALYMTGAICVGVFAYGALMRAMRTGEVSAVTPFRYSRLLLGVGLGVLWFGESIDVQMVLGCGLIVLSGLYILWRGARAG